MIANYLESLIPLRILHPFRMTMIRFLTGARRIRSVCTVEQTVLNICYPYYQ